MLKEEEVYGVLKQVFPLQNDFVTSDFSDELRELLDFGIQSKARMLELMRKHRDAVMEIDSAVQDEEDLSWFIEEFGHEFVEERVTKKFWYGYPALMRIVLELEFGDKYIEYCNKRDNLE